MLIKADWGISSIPGSSQSNLYTEICITVDKAQLTYICLKSVEIFMWNDF